MTDLGLMLISLQTYLYAQAWSLNDGYGTKHLYEELPDWNLFGKIIEMPEDVEVDGIANTYVAVPRRVEVYSLSGTRLKEPLRGLNIVDGRKVIVWK